MGNTQESKEFINLENQSTRESKEFINLDNQSITENFRFFWKGNDNPYDKSTPIWVPYDLSDNQLLETSYQNFIKGIKDELIIGDYSYDFKKWMQTNIHDNYKQRPIKRDLPSNITNIMRKNRFQESLISSENKNKINQIDEYNIKNLLEEVEFKFNVIKNNYINFKVPKHLPGFL